MENQFSQSKPLLCESIYDSSRWEFVSRLRSLSTRVRRNLSLTIARVTKVVRAGLAASLMATSNNRLYLGAFLMLVVAPLSGMGYQLLDRTVEIPGWYHMNYWNLFFVIGPHISGLLMTTGVFFLFPANTKRSYFLSVPAAHHVAKIIWIIQVDNNADYYRMVPAYFYITGLFVAVLWLITFDWLMSLHFHKRDGCLARAEGILNLPGIPAEEKVTIAKEQFRQYRSFK